MTAPDRELVEQLVEELTSHAPMEIVLRALTMFQLAALLQLALRHPSVAAELRASGERFLQTTRVYFVDCPAILEALRRGDDPAEDVVPDPDPRRV